MYPNHTSDASAIGITLYSSFFLIKGPIVYKLEAMGIDFYICELVTDTIDRLV